ncbi:MAG: nucleotide exchange factor GrpE [Oceanospirillaceae bacterium]|uniref:nucleotide exchange factor GrpE n=1 Tax=unclassified Thalassolituus TaxID=2624967 RepID=UPI000C6A3CDF|nr:MULTISPECIES: nucleotide exchange factor GrpE [unclassified Thalassolituus]MAY00608.1 nucleotide exchange factor GrpE [Oceanospirillaceae bacterium]MBS52260.1 nucleotide exchange factor GrpE [Oceanospirillaceae bacterium]|tara:strand:- start:155 stop:745 length:591 start_codon:yes stop_codon:yes gene_type:complete
MSDEQKIQEEQQEQLNEEQVNQAPEAEESTGESAAEGVDALAAAQQEIADLKEQMLRTQAEMQNVRRRAEADVEKAHKFGVEKFANEMLTVVDNLERALAAAAGDDEATKAIREGVEMTLSGLVAGLSKFKVEAVDPQGETFNPELHQAMSMIENPDVDPNTVIAVMQKGYTLQGRLLRPAMVMVSKGAAKIDENA